MTNIYDVLSQMHVKANTSAEKAVEEDLEKEDPPVEEAKAILENAIPLQTDAKFDQKLEKSNESTKGNDTKRGSRSNKQDL